MISGENSAFRLIRCTDEAGWLTERRKGVGGSDVAAIMGLSPWRTPAEVWFEKTGRAEPQDLSDRPNIVFGNIMEPVIADWHRSKYPDLTIRRVNAICQSIERPWAQASLDYEIHAPELGWGVLEIKTARDKRDWKDGVPAYYLTQVTHYLAVTGRAFAAVAVFFRDEAEFARYAIERDEEDIAAVNSAVDAFWHDYVQADVMPALVGTDGEARGLAQAYASPEGDSVTDTSAETLGLVSEYQDAADREKQAKADKQRAATMLMEKVGDHRQLFTETSKVTWSRGPAERFDSRRFKSDYPGLWQQYSTTYTRNGGLRVTDLKKG